MKENPPSSAKDSVGASPAASISEMFMEIVIGRVGRARVRVFKHLAPVTLGKIQLAAPFGGRLNFFDRSFAYIITPVIAGEEKARSQFKKGEVAFFPGGSMLCFFLQDTRSYKAMNLLGHIEDIVGLSALQKMRRGDTVLVEKFGSVTAAGGSSLSA